MAASLGASRYLVDGVALAATGVALHHDGAGIFDGFGEEITTSTTPGVDGGVIRGGSFRPYVLPVSYKIRGSGFDDVWAKIRTLRRNCKPGQTVTLTREMPDPDGTDANTDATTVARRQDDRPVWLTAADAALEINWLICEPWHGASVNIATGAGAHTILGDTRTHRMTITLAAGAARSIANTTTGHLLQFLATVPSGGVLIDVEARTATAITGGADLSQYLVWTKVFPMQFAAGSNVLSTDAGTFSVDYQPAYL